MINNYAIKCKKDQRVFKKKRNYFSLKQKYKNVNPFKIIKISKMKINYSNKFIYLNRMLSRIQPMF